MGDRLGAVEDGFAMLVRVDSWPTWPDSSRSAAQERADVVQNKLANVICNAELALDMIDGPARARLEAILRAAWSASQIVAALPLSGADAVKRPA